MLDPRHLAKQGGHPLHIPFLANIDMGNLVISHGERPAGPRIEIFPPQVRFSRQQACLPHDAVGMDRPVNGRNTVLGENDDAAATVPEEVEQSAAGFVQLPQISMDRSFRPHLLQDVVR